MGNQSIIGKRYGHLVIIAKTKNYNIHKDGYKEYYYICQCDCGDKCTRLIREIKQRKNISCGCLDHVKSKPEYNIWCDIKKRCFNKNSHAYDRYGGRGITLYSEWIHSFPKFYFWLKHNIGFKPPNKTLDRINNNGNYEPGNLRWATIEEQNQNQRQNKLTPEIVRELRNDFQNTKLSMAEFLKENALKYNACMETIRQVLKNQTWKNII